MGKSPIKPIDFDEMGGSMVIYRFLWKITYKLPFKPRKRYFPLPLLVTPGIPTHPEASCEASPLALREKATKCA